MPDYRPQQLATVSANILAALCLALNTALTTVLTTVLTTALTSCVDSADGDTTAAGAGGSIGLPTGGNVLGVDTVSAKALDSSANADGGAASADSNAALGDAGTTGNADGGGTADTGAGGADSGQVGDGQPPQDSEPALEDTEPALDDAEPGLEDTEPGLEDTEPELEDTEPATKSDIKDNGEDPNKPWYTIPIADQYIGPDLPDTSPSETSTSAIPPVCSPLIGSVSVTESVGAGGKIDIVVWIDTSGSMSQEAAWTNQNMNKFTLFLESKKIDYKLVLYGTGLGLCIGPPLGDGLCNSAQPQKFLAVKFGVASTNGLTLMQTPANFAKFSLFLRPDAVHNMIGITDDNSSTPAATFKANYSTLLNNAGLNSKFVYHAICSFANEANPNQAGNCNTGASYSKQHIELAQSTNGTLYQVCKNDWTAIFDGLSKAVAATAKPVCTYNLPAPATKKYNPANVKVSHLENGVVVSLKKIANGTSCAESPNGWFYDNAVTPTTATLCDSQCKQLVGGAIVFNFGCAL